MDTRPLEDLGLTRAEIMVYLSLLELGSTKVGPIIEKSNLQSSVVHNTLHKLLEKGIISYVKKGKIRYYAARNPKTFMEFIEDKKKNFQAILPELVLKQTLAKDLNEAEVYEGNKGIMTMLLELIDGCKPGDTWEFFSTDVESMNEGIQEFFRRTDPKRKAKSLVNRGIAREQLRPLFEERQRKGYLTMRYTKSQVIPNTTIVNDYIALFSWGEKPVSFLIHSKQLAEKYRAYFYSIWDSLPAKN